MFAELTFRALIVAVDDFGRLDARPAKLKAALFPMRNEVAPSEIMEWVNELANLPEPPIKLYEVNGRPYLALTGWEKHRGKGRRAAESRYPQPPDENDSNASAEILGSDCDVPEKQSNPPVGSGTRDGGREAGDENRGTSKTPLSDSPPDARPPPSKAKKPDPPSKPTFEAQVRDVWPELRAAAAAKGGRWAETPGKIQVRTIAARLRDGHTTAELIQAIAGAWYFWKGNGLSGDFDATKYVRVETIYQASKFDGYLDSYRTSRPAERRTRDGPSAQFLDLDDPRPPGAIQ